MTFAIRMPWDEGPCAVMLVQRRDTGPRSAVTDLLWSSLALCAVLLGAVLFAAGPIVERVRSLTAQVRHSASVRYAAPVDERGRDEISELARAFNSAGSDVRANLEAVETRERTLRTFVENTSHDVMLPLTVLQGHLTALRRRVDAGQLPDKETVRSALEESHYLSSLLQNLSVAAKLEGGEPLMARHPVDLNALVERAVARQRPIAKQKNVQVEFAVPEDTIHLFGDMTFVEQMLSNVIHNAVRYNHEGGHVAVLLEERGAEHDEFALRVLDDGPGIPTELRERVVERSFRTDEARSRAPDGLGLGLSIAHDVARRHGLTMTMKESPAGGLEVEFTGRRARIPTGDGGARALGAGEAPSA
ncbi:MAG: HAMP domain-containing histidine kinase [Planctomycetes bacterium]|nr:HAMP domain-containing histidine kinase [Planctomycetota bacterium]